MGKGALDSIYNCGSMSDKSELIVGNKVNCGLLTNFLVIFAIITILGAPFTSASAITFDPAVTILNPTPVAADQFGFSVAISGTKVVVGVPSDDTGAADAGVVYVYDCTPACAVPETILNPTPVAADQFGFSVAISGTKVVVGANLDDTGAADAGVVYVYDCTPACAAPETILNPTPVASELFGHSVAISGTKVVVGAFG